MSVAMPRTVTRGVVYVHSTPKALCPHIIWAIEAVLGTRVSLDWTTSPRRRASCAPSSAGRASAGTGARIASALRGWDDLRYEVTEEPSAGLRRLALVAHAAPRHPPHVDLGQR